MKTKFPTHLIRNCEFKYACRKTWISLTKITGINEELIRYCDDCNQKVHLVNSSKSLLWHIENNDCVAIPFEMTTRYEGLQRVGQPTVGMVKFK
jgi:hypothetical protein